MPQSFTRRAPRLLIMLLASATGLLASETAPPRALDYPKDLRAFRARALKADGVFAPDIAFALRKCPKCGRRYVFGTFPRLQRQPFDSLAAVHLAVETACLKKAPSAMMYSPRLGQLVPRACPVCEDPEAGGRPDKVLFCHVLPETGDDLQIEYEIKAGALASRTFWRVPKGGEAVSVNLPDETEDALKQALGQHFSLRAVWNELFARGSREDLFTLQEPQIVYRQVAPGMWFVFRPRNVTNAAFKEFTEKQLKPDRDRGLFTRLDTPLQSGGDLDTRAGGYRDWAAAYEPALSGGKMECFVALSYPELRQAAREVLASRGLDLEFASGTKDSQAGTGILRKGGYSVEISFAPLGAQAILAGLSLHHACAYCLTTPVFTVEGAERLSRILRARYAQCAGEVLEGRYLVLRDEDKQERKLDLLALADKLDPGNQYMFDLFCSVLLAWDRERGRFGPQARDRDVAPTGLPAFVERRIRPAGHLKSRNLPDALYEPREDQDGKGYDLCYTSECSAALVYVDPAKDRFKGLTLEDAQRLYGAAAGTLPMFIDAQDTLSLPGDRGLRPPVPFCKATLLCGLDLAALAADRGRATTLAGEAGIVLRADDRLHFYAFTTNLVALTPRQLTPDELRLVQARARDLAAESGLDPGLDLGLHFDLPLAEPRGRVLRRNK